MGFPLLLGLCICNVATLASHAGVAETHVQELLLGALAVDEFLPAVAYVPKGANAESFVKPPRPDVQAEPMNCLGTELEERQADIGA
jgi:hypothetical protein